MGGEPVFGGVHAAGDRVPGKSVLGVDEKQYFSPHSFTAVFLFVNDRQRFVTNRVDQK